jgi:hypothetical protein
MSEPWKDSADDEPGDAPPASAPRDDGRTHYDDTDTAKGCWTEHLDCARSEIERLRSALASRDAEIARLRAFVDAVRDYLDLNGGHDALSCLCASGEDEHECTCGWTDIESALRALAAPPDRAAADA